MWNLKQTDKQKQKLNSQIQRTDWCLLEVGLLGMWGEKWVKGVKKYKLAVIK